MDAFPTASKPEDIGPLYDEIRGQLDAKTMSELRKLAKAVRIKPARSKFLTVTRIMEVWLNKQREAVGKEKPPPPKEEKGGDPPPEADLFDRAELHRRIEREVKGLEEGSPAAYVYQRIKKMSSRKQIQLYRNLRFDFAGMRSAFGDPGIELAKLEIAKRLVAAVAHIKSKKQIAKLREFLDLFSSQDVVMPSGALIPAAAQEMDELADIGRAPMRVIKAIAYTPEEAGAADEQPADEEKQPEDEQPGAADEQPAEEAADEKHPDDGPLEDEQPGRPRVHNVERLAEYVMGQYNKPFILQRIRQIKANRCDQFIGIHRMRKLALARLLARAEPESIDII